MKQDDLPQIQRIWVFRIYGQSEKFADIDDAIEYVKETPERGKSKLPLVRFEIQVTYANGMHIDARIEDKTQVIEFLENRKKGLL